MWIIIALENLPYDFNIDGLINELRKRKVKRVLIQLPNGLKKYHKHIVDYIRENLKEVEIWVSLTPTYGACDVAINEAEKLNADLIVHIGHNEYPCYKPTKPTLFIEAYYRWVPSSKILNLLLNKLEDIGCENVGLVAVVQHINSIKAVEKFLRDNKINVIVPKPVHRVMVLGQVLGCEYSCATSIVANVDCYIIISGGIFHALGLWLATQKHVIKLDPYENNVVLVDEYAKKVLKKRYMKIMQALQGKTMGIIDGSKPGQHRPWLVKALKEKAEEKGVKTILYITDYLNEERLLNIDTCDIDFYVVTLCPRIAIDDLGDYIKPVLTPGEAFMVLEEQLEHYRFPW